MKVADQPLVLPVSAAATRPVDDVLAGLGSRRLGLTEDEAHRRLHATGPNTVLTHGVSGWAVLARQLRSPLLVLLAGAAAVSYAVGSHTDAIIIGVILVLSVGLGFANEFRAERAAAALHSAVRHTAVTIRDGRPVLLDVTQVVAGDVVQLRLGEVVPADMRLLEVDDLECDESVLTGESMPVRKQVAPVADGGDLAGLASCVLMGTIVHRGAGTAVVVATATATEFGRVASLLGRRHPETQFQVGLRRFSGMLLIVATVLVTAIFVINLLLARPLIEALLFSLAIAVGITPQLLPAIVTTGLATGSHRLAQRKVLVKRLVCIEDLGDIDVLVTDKTGTLTQGTVGFTTALDPAGRPDHAPLRLGLACTDPRTADPGNALDAALWQVPDAATLAAGHTLLAQAPFDHDRRMSSALVDLPDGRRTLITKGAPESVLARCVGLPDTAQAALRAQFAAGARVIAVATRPAPHADTVAAADEHGLTLAGFLVFADPVKPDAADALARLASLGITVKVATGDNPQVAEKICAELGLHGATLTGGQIDALTDTDLAAAARKVCVFARVSPEQKARVIRVLREQGRAVAFLGDGVNDAVALHAADIGISVDTAADVAKDAADVVLLDKDLHVLADGIVEGRRIFTNTVKYVLMGTSSNFGNMFSAAGASAFLPFLPMLPSQILLNNLLYDTSQLAIPTDRVDPEQLHAPSHWDLHLIRRFMLFFGPISSLFDFITFAIMIGVFSAGPALFRSGWFVESLATQTLVIFAIRTRRSPFTRSRPSLALMAAATGVVAIGVALPLSPLAGPLGFEPLPLGLFAALTLMCVAYLTLVEFSKRMFFAEPAPAPAGRWRGLPHRIHRRAARFSSHHSRPPRQRVPTAPAASVGRTGR
ncbi:magnesium-translocating P-type ATPase [Catellatospora citrea]|uniref:magnesium-translocating P-type ATPase n=1 Tax=Catellatospora citrea TaxID=53366 RepID=UPI0033DE770A